jgi:hypothetical protein
MDATVNPCTLPLYKVPPVRFPHLKSLASATILVAAIPFPARSQVNVTVDATSVVRTVDPRVFGMNTAVWDSLLGGADSTTLLNAIGTGALRFPGGSTADAYTWTAADTDELAGVIQATGAEAFITVNYGSGTPQQAAAWVTYANVTKGYGFKYWEVGNENYGSWEMDNNLPAHDPVEYANRFAQYYAMMKAADPTIKVGAVSPTSTEGPFNSSHTVLDPVTGKDQSGWVAVMLSTLKSAGVTPDFLICHRYEQQSGQENDATLLQLASAAATGWPADAALLRTPLNDFLGASGANVELCVTENNSVHNNPGKQTTSLVNGLYRADALGSLLQTEFNSLLWWDLRNGPPTPLATNVPGLYGWRDFGDYGIVATDVSPPPAGYPSADTPYPAYYVQKLLTHFAAGGDKVVKAASSNSLLAAYAALRADGSLSILVINKSPTATTNGAFSISGFAPAASATLYSYGIPQDNAAQANDTADEDVAVSTISNAGATFSASFGPYSATVLSLSSSASGPAPTPTPTPPPGTGSGNGSARLINISTRAQVGTGANILIPGFVIGGSGTETLLIRADGPALAAFGVAGALAQPSLSVFDSTGTVVASNTGWGTNSNAAQISSAAASVGAFALPSGSADCALIASLPAGAYTVQVSGVNNSTGVALAEVYEVSSSGTRLVNISTRALVGTGANIIIPGFVIAGSGSDQLLARGDGPALTGFGVGGALAQPSLSVFDSSGNVIASNTGWATNSNPAQLVSAATSVGAFALPSGSADSALIVNVTAGAYTMQISGVNNSTGVALAEVYEVP